MNRPALAWADLGRLIEIRILLTFVAVALGLAAFAGLTDEVREGGVLGIDRILLLAFRSPGRLDVPIGPRWVLEAARDVTALGGVTVLMLISIIATVMLLIHARRLHALIFAATVVGAQVLSESIKAWIGRPRPNLVGHLDLVYSSSFPSGHAMMTPVVYLTAAGLLAAGMQRRSERVFLLVGAMLLTAAVGVSRVYLGVHWPSDVLGGWILGSAVAMGATIALHLNAPHKS